MVMVSLGDFIIHSRGFEVSQYLHIDLLPGNTALCYFYAMVLLIL